MSLSAIFNRPTEIEASGGSAVLVTVIASEGHAPSKAGAKLLWEPGGSITGTVGGGALEKLCMDFSAGLTGNQTALKTYSLDKDKRLFEGEPTGMICGGKVTVFFERLAPKESVVIFGAGHIGRALAYHLAPLDFSITLYDDRPDFVGNFPRSPGTEALQFSIEDIPALIKGEPYIIVASYSHDMDYRIMKTVLEHNPCPRYLGVMASRKKKQQFFTNLKKDLPGGFTPENVYSPCGLNIGTGKPHEIALAVAGELLAVRQGSDAIFHMRDRESGADGA